MAITDYRIEEFSNPVSKMPDNPTKEGFSVEEIKAWFDSNAENEIKTSINGIVDYLENKDKLDALADKVVYTGAIDAYFDYALGTLEYRSVCTQPIKDSMSVAAFHVGLKHKVQDLENIFSDSCIYDGDYNATELRKLLIKREIPEAIDEDELYKIAKSVLDLAKDGLEERGFGEEIFLNPLYHTFFQTNSCF